MDNTNRMWHLQNLSFEMFVMGYGILSLGHIPRPYSGPICKGQVSLENEATTSVLECWSTDLLVTVLSLLLHRASCRFTKYHTTNKCTNCMSFILNLFFKTLFTAPTCFDSISLIIIREHI